MNFFSLKPGFHIEHRAEVFLGAYNASALLNDGNVIKFGNPGYLKVHIHEKFDTNELTNDIALITLDRKVQFTDLIKPICLPETSSRFGGNELTHVAGIKLNKFNLCIL